MPQVNDTTKGLFRRFIIVPFNVEIPEHRQDKTLAKTIIESELAGVLNWALQGLRRILTAKEFTPCKSAEIQLKKYQAEQDNVTQFCQEIELTPDDEQKECFKSLFGEYLTFCRDNNYRPCSKGTFRTRLERQGITLRNGAGNVLFAFCRRGYEVSNEDKNLPF